MVEGWLIGEVGFFEVSLGNHRSDRYFCPSTLLYLRHAIFFRKISKAKFPDICGNIIARKPEIPVCFAL